MFGILNVNKPEGYTSRDAVNRIQRLVRPVKVGHAGTLDPLATGVLVVCLGQATRLIEYVQRMRKCYLATFLLGRQSDTEDMTGEVIELPEAHQPLRSEIEAVLPNFIGEIDQRPPAYSALKVDGVRAYKLARQGEQPTLSSRRIHVHQIKIVEYEYPQLALDVVCGSGTYVRSLGRDIAQSLGTAAAMSGLVRTAVGCFDVSEACDPSELTREAIDSFIQPASRAVEELPKVTLNESELRRIANGLVIANRFDEQGVEIAAFDESGSLRAIVQPRGDELRPAKFFPQSESLR
jgi:tRNA pseudouridine55 synthase